MLDALPHIRDESAEIRLPIRQFRPLHPESVRLNGMERVLGHADGVPGQAQHAVQARMTAAELPSGLFIACHDFREGSGKIPDLEHCAATGKMVMGMKPPLLLVKKHWQWQILVPGKKSRNRWGKLASSTKYPMLCKRPRHSANLASSWSRAKDSDAAAVSLCIDTLVARLCSQIRRRMVLMGCDS